MPDSFIESIIGVLSLVSFLAYLILVVVITGTLLRRFRLYRSARQSTPLLLRRDIVLFLALSIFLGEILLIRVLDITVFSEIGWPRVFLIAHQNIIIIGALAYWAKVELTDL